MTTAPAAHPFESATMFTVKATYSNETRKFTFPDSVLFPTYEQLHQQLRRIFSISHGYRLSELIFSPDAFKPGRILVGREVHSAEEYDHRVAPLRRLWPNPLLRFIVCDQTLLDAQSEASQSLSFFSGPIISPLCKLSSSVTPRHNGFLPQKFIPPPPPAPQRVTSILSSPPSKLSPPSLPPSMSPPLPTESGPSHDCGTAPCCPIARGKEDIQVLLSSFKEDLERILCRTLGADYVEQTSTPNVHDSTCSASTADVISPQIEVAVPAGAKTSSQWCFVCKASFTGIRYGCIKCLWHAVCPGCFSKSHRAHTLSFGPSHVVQRQLIDRFPSAQIVSENKACNSISGACRSPPTSPGPAGESTLFVHRGVVCDSCDKTVVGIRHKCLDCPDYDLCTACVESGATEQHNPFHEFFDIEVPGRVYVHTVLDDDRSSSFGNHQQFSNFNRAPAVRQEAAGNSTELPVRHSATCNLCDSAIVGERYKCVACPGEVIYHFDTCSSCFRITTEQHPRHGFVKVHKPEDLMMRDSIPLCQVTHFAICDSCRKTIRGARYKCIHPDCPDFDLCSDCEALPIPVHPLNHPLLKLRAPDTIIPTAYTVGPTTDEPLNQKSTVCGEATSPVLLPQSPLVAFSKSPEQSHVAPEQVTSVTLEDQAPFAEEFLSPLGSPASQVLRAPSSVTMEPSRLVGVAVPPGSPRSVPLVSDDYHQMWPRVNQEMVHLNAVERVETEGLIINSIKNSITDPACLDLPVAEVLLPGSPAISPTDQTGELHGTFPVSPTPSTKSIFDGYRTPSSTPSNVRESHCVIQQSFASDQHETDATNAPRPSCLDSALISNTNVPDGQIFPPGAEFVKGWHVINNGELPWPKTTEVQFVAGETFAPERGAALRAKVGIVRPGEELDIWTGDLKAPDAAGRYVGYWRLSDGPGNFFGSSVWIDLRVADHQSDQASEQSLAASSMVMPSAHPTNSVNVSDEPRDAPRPSLSSTKTVTDEVDGPESDVSSVSLVSVPTSDDEDAEWQDTRTHSEALEYVVLYDSNSEE